MRTDIVLITRDRPELTSQCIRSLFSNASNADTTLGLLVVVYDGTHADMRDFIDSSQDLADDEMRYGEWITTGQRVGVGGAKNYGAQWLAQKRGRSSSLTPSDLVMFLDNDLYLLPGWDARLELAMKLSSDRTDKRLVTQLGGWRHPFHASGRSLIEGGWFENERERVVEVDAATGNCFVMRWSDWLKYGPFDANAIGPGQSEDYALSQKIRAGGGVVATLDPPVAIHCGLVNSDGDPAVGWMEMEELVTRQLAELTPEMRDDVLIMRPAPMPIAIRLDKMRQMGMEQAKHAQLERAKESGLQPGPVIPSRCMPGHVLYRPHGDLAAIAKRAAAERLADRLNDAAVEMGYMRPVDPIRVPIEAVIASYHGLGLRREITVEDARSLYPRAKLGINVGSGQRRFESTPAVAWVNVDVISRPPDQVPDVICNVGTEKLPFTDGVVDYVVAHHVYEHFHLGEGDAMIREAYRVLKPGGSLFVFTPDLRKLAGRWLNGEIDDYTFMVQTYGAYQGQPGDDHHWGYDQMTLWRAMHNATPTTYEWSKIKPFDWREIPGMDAARDWYIAAVECVK